jgi:hypothetical protein
MARVIGGGSTELAALAVRLKATGDKGLRVELLHGLKSGASPLVDKVAEAARSQLPHGGGLNEQVAGQKVKVQVRTGARTAGVRLTTSAPDTKQTDSGIVRHPVYGNRKKWVTQKIPKAAGWWSKTLERGAPWVQPKLRESMDRIAEAIQRGGL